MDSPAAGVAHLRPPLFCRCTFGSPNSGAAVLRGRPLWKLGACTPQRIYQRSSAGTLPIVSACATRRSPGRCHIRSAAPLLRFRTHRAPLCGRSGVYAVRTAREAPSEVPGVRRHPKLVAFIVGAADRNVYSGDAVKLCRLCLLVHLVLNMSITIVEGAQGRYASGQYPDLSHTLVRKCQKGSIT